MYLKLRLITLKSKEAKIAVEELSLKNTGQNHWNFSWNHVFSRNQFDKKVTPWFCTFFSWNHFSYVDLTLWFHVKTAQCKKQQSLQKILWNQLFTDMCSKLTSRNQVFADFLYCAVFTWNQITKSQKLKWFHGKKVQNQDFPVLSNWFYEKCILIDIFSKNDFTKNNITFCPMWSVVWKKIDCYRHHTYI